jgi:hypothetical protein
MRIIESVDLDTLQVHEKATNCNVKLGSYKMDQICPIAEFQINWVLLDDSELERIFLLGEFGKMTHNKTNRLIDVMDLLPDDTTKRIDERILSRNLDIRLQRNESLMIVATNIEDGPLTIIDGNHRAMNHFKKHNNIQDVPAYVCVHPNISRWPFVPRLARKQMMFRGKFQEAKAINSNKPYWKSEWFIKYGLAYWNDKVPPKGGNYWLNKLK